MATEGNGGLGSSEEVREGQQIGPPLESVAAFPLEDSTQNTFPWLESYIHKLAREAFQHVVISGPASVAAFPLEDSTQNTFPWLESYIRKLAREAFQHVLISGPASVAAFPLVDSTQNTSPWLESYVRKLAREAFQHVVISGPAREQIQEPDRRILQLCFETSMPDHFFVGKKVKGRDGAICVKLIDATTGHVVESGPMSSLTLDVVVLAGDFKNKDDWVYFKSNVETGREGKGPLLEGDLQVPLKAGVGSLAEFKFTDISTCSRSGKFRLGVKVESGFFMGIRVREAETAAFQVKHYKKKAEEKHVPRALDDDVCTLKGIGKKGPLCKNLNDIGIFEVKDFLRKLCLDPEGLRKVLGKTVSDMNWKTLKGHAKESVPSGKYHVYYADNMKNSGIVFKNMSELCGLIEDGKCYSVETLSDSQKESTETLKKVIGDNRKDIAEYDGPLPLEMNPSNIGVGRLDCSLGGNVHFLGSDVNMGNVHFPGSGSGSDVNMGNVYFPGSYVNMGNVYFPGSGSGSGSDVNMGNVYFPGSDVNMGNVYFPGSGSGSGSGSDVNMGNVYSPGSDDNMGNDVNMGNVYLPGSNVNMGDVYLPGSDVNMGDVNMGDVYLPGSDVNMGNVYLPGSNVNMRNVSMGNVYFPGSDVNMGSVYFPGSDVNTGRMDRNTSSPRGNVSEGGGASNIASMDSKFEEHSVKEPVD